MKQGVLALLMWLSTGAPASATTLVVAGEIASVKAPVEYSNRPVRPSPFSRLRNPTDAVRITVIFNEREHDCRKASVVRGVMREICRVSNAQGESSFARVEVSARGFQTFTINVPRLERSGGDVLIIEIGSVQLVPAQVPTVEQITLGTDDRGNHVFRIVIDNKLKRSWLIRSIGVAGRATVVGPYACASPTPVTFRLSSELRLSGAGGGDEKIDGKVIEAVQGQELTLPLTGTFVHDSCSGYQQLTMQTDTAFELPRDQYQTVLVYVPDTFEIARVSRSTDQPSTTPWGSLPFEQFSRWRFVLQPEPDSESYVSGEFVVEKDRRIR